jgi:hypothetical protein
MDGRRGLEVSRVERGRWWGEIQKESLREGFEVTGASPLRSQESDGLEGGRVGRGTFD